MADWAIACSNPSSNLPTPSFISGWWTQRIVLQTRWTTEVLQATGREILQQQKSSWQSLAQTPATLGIARCCAAWLLQLLFLEKNELNFPWECPPLKQQHDIQNTNEKQQRLSLFIWPNWKFPKIVPGPEYKPKLTSTLTETDTYEYKRVWSDPSHSQWNMKDW